MSRRQTSQALIVWAPVSARLWRLRNDVVTLVGLRGAPPDCVLVLAGGETEGSHRRQVKTAA